MLPTESRENGECNTDIVEDVIDQLNELNYFKTDRNKVQYQVLQIK